MLYSISLYKQINFWVPLFDLDQKFKLYLKNKHLKFNSNIELMFCGIRFKNIIAGKTNRVSTLRFSHVCFVFQM